MYSQKCHYGFLTAVDGEADEISTQKGMMVVCHNSQCPEKYCKYSYFTGGVISDIECPYFVKNERNKVR